VLTINSFKGFEEELDDTSTNVRVRMIVTSPFIFIARIDNFLSFSQLLKEIVAGEIKIINEKIKIQLKSSIAYVNIVKEFKSKNMEFHAYKRKQEKSFRVFLKHIHAIANLDDIKKEIDDLEHTVTNI